LQQNFKYQKQFVPNRLIKPCTLFNTKNTGTPVVNSVIWRRKRCNAIGISERIRSYFHLYFIKRMRRKTVQI